MGHRRHSASVCQLEAVIAFPKQRYTFRNLTNLNSFHCSSFYSSSSSYCCSPPFALRRNTSGPSCFGWAAFSRMAPGSAAAPTDLTAPCWPPAPMRPCKPACAWCPTPPRADFSDWNRPVPGLRRPPCGCSTWPAASCSSSPAPRRAPRPRPKPGARRPLRAGGAGRQRHRPPESSGAVGFPFWTQKMPCTIVQGIFYVVAKPHGIHVMGSGASRRQRRRPNGAATRSTAARYLAPGRKQPGAWAVEPLGPNWLGPRGRRRARPRRHAYFQNP